MTLDEFFAELSLTCGQWKILYDDSIRHRDSGCCPLAQTANQRLGKEEFNSRLGYEAGEFLDLTDDEIHDIIFAADNGLDDCELQDVYDIREQLLKVIGLEESPK